MQTELVCEDAAMQTQPAEEGISTQTELVCTETAMQTQPREEGVSTQTELVCAEAAMQTAPTGDGTSTQTELLNQDMAMQTEPPPCAETAMQTAPKEEGIATQTEIALEEVAVQTEIIRHVEAAVAGVLSKVDLLHFLPEVADSKSGAWQVVDPLTLREAPGKIHAALDAAVPDGQDLHILDENELVTGELLRIHDITGQLLWQSGRLGEEPPKKIVEACKATEIVVVFEDNFEDLDEGGELKCIAGLTDKDHL